MTYGGNFETIAFWKRSHGIDAIRSKSAFSEREHFSFDIDSSSAIKKYLYHQIGAAVTRHIENMLRNSFENLLKALSVRRIVGGFWLSRGGLSPLILALGGPR